jgi:hypothetical protein
LKLLEQRVALPGVVLQAMAVIEHQIAPFDALKELKVRQNALVVRDENIEANATGARTTGRITVNLVNCHFQKEGAVSLQGFPRIWKDNTFQPLEILALVL